MRRTAFWFVIGLAVLGLSVGLVTAQSTGAEILVNRDGVNVRLFPAIGAEVLGFVEAGWRAPATGRSPDNQWIRIDFNGEEGWIGFPTINLFGDINALPVADPRSIPYGGFESPRSGLSSASGPVSGKLVDSGLRVRGGPSRAYPVLANAPRYTIFPLLGRTANNAWVQVNFEGTLGWVAIRYVQILNNASILDLPIDGIVADQAPLSEATATDYQATLRFLLDRVDLAQPSLDAIRGIWTTIALGSRSHCGPFPARPTNYNIPNPLLAAYYPTLNPIQGLFNDAMTNVRLSIDLWLEVCRAPQPDQGVVGQATVTGALEAVNLAGQQFDELRRRINELLPPALELGPDKCLFTFQGASDVLPVVPIGEIIRDTFDPSTPVVGYCFDVNAGQSMRFEFLQVSGNATPRVTVTPFDNPTAFIANGLAVTGEKYLSVGPIIITTPGRHLLIVSHEDDFLNTLLTSDFAVLISDVTGASLTGPTLFIDPNTGQPTKGVPQVNPIVTPLPGVPTPVITCPSITLTCDFLVTCEFAQACFAAGNASLDDDGDGVPCENLCTGG
ncbi:MAG: SH3 domain-containing protein [Anaerolineae bacterium]|nr:SH3 domain-containing protein [Anaerolineae bacterium]